jgi:predicted nucleic acid-binding protein
VSRLVVDASIVVKWFLPEVLAAHALRVAESDQGLVAPELLAAEFASALWKKQRRGEIGAPAAAGILADFSRVSIELVPLMPLMPSAFGIAAAAGHSVYDCWYLALAEREDGRVVTADRRFHRAFSEGSLSHRMLWVEAF